MTMKLGMCGFTIGADAYFRQFPVLEVQHTFYDPPPLKTLEGWRARAPAEFEFTIENGAVTMGAHPSPFGIDSARVPDVVAAILESGSIWSGLHMFSGAQTLDGLSPLDHIEPGGLVSAVDENLEALGRPLGIDADDDAL